MLEFVAGQKALGSKGSDIPSVNNSCELPGVPVGYRATEIDIAETIEVLQKIGCDVVRSPHSPPDWILGAWWGSETFFPRGVPPGDVLYLRHCK